MAVVVMMMLETEGGKSRLRSSTPLALPLAIAAGSTRGKVNLKAKTHTFGARSRIIHSIRHALGVSSHKSHASNKHIVLSDPVQHPMESGVLLQYIVACNLRSLHCFWMNEARKMLQRLGK